MAGLSRKGGASRPKPHMNVTPLVDVVLVLLIIFMIVIPAMEEGLNLEVPQVQTPDPEGSTEEDHVVMLSIDNRGHLFIDEQRVPDGELEAHLERAHARHPRWRLVLRGDRGAEYGEVRALFATASTIGFPGVSLRVNFNGDESGDAPQSK
ncbi:MAG: biopolymer transporter ExbD [Sandaracinaceae bacterium]|nr:MAG: biopolymer transporter ExbD [Sandaracinaceae bacterium]HBQ15377.1 biopolymer transporter ExbD [Myxococcales bacterium]